MRDEYDFTEGERGRFYQPGAKFNLPVYLDDDVLTYLNKRATSKGVEVNELINEMLRKDIDLIKAVK